MDSWCQKAKVRPPFSSGYFHLISLHSGLKIPEYLSIYVTSPNNIILNYSFQHVGLLCPYRAAVKVVSLLTKTLPCLSLSHVSAQGWELILVGRPCLLTGDTRRSEVQWQRVHPAIHHSTFYPSPRTRRAVRDLILGDGALLYIAYVMCFFPEHTQVTPGLPMLQWWTYNILYIIWAPLISATRWSCSRSLADSNYCWLQLHIEAGIDGAKISITGVMLSASSPQYKVSGASCLGTGRAC